MFGIQPPFSTGTIAAQAARAARQIHQAVVAAFLLARAGDGAFISGHPLKRFGRQLQRLGVGKTLCQQVETGQAAHRPYIHDALAKAAVARIG